MWIRNRCDETLKHCKLYVKMFIPWVNIHPIFFFKLRKRLEAHKWYSFLLGSHEINVNWTGWGKSLYAMSQALKTVLFLSFVLEGQNLTMDSRVSSYSSELLWRRKNWSSRNTQLNTSWYPLLKLQRIAN